MRTQSLLIGAASVIATTAFLLGMRQPTSACGAHCGVYRWAVKTIAPATVPSAWANAGATVSQMNAIVAPSPYPGTHAGRTAPVETTWYTIDACLWGITNQRDRDYHLMINDKVTHAKTMIVEVPSSTCSDACASAYAAHYTAVRLALGGSAATATAVRKAEAMREAVERSGNPQEQPGVALLKVPVDVQVTGAGFWDKRGHGTGHSDNGVELHPLIAITVTSTACTPPSAARIRQILAEPVANDYN